MGIHAHSRSALKVVVISYGKAAQGYLNNRGTTHVRAETHRMYNKQSQNDEQIASQSEPIQLLKPSMTVPSSYLTGHEVFWVQGLIVH